jgi:hypothetical protein
MIEFLNAHAAAGGLVVLVLVGLTVLGIIAWLSKP